MRAWVYVMLLACTKSSPATAPSASASVAVAAPADAALVTDELPKVDFGPRGPIVVTGYPTKIGTGMDDSADYVGFTSDGKKFGYCLHFGGLGQLDCVTRDAAGTQTTESDRSAPTAPNPLDPKKTSAIEKWIASSGMPKLTQVKGTFEWSPPPLVGDWGYARDIELRVLVGAATQPFVKLGGKLAGEDPVWVVTSSAPHRKSGAGEIPYQFTVVNGLQLSPDGNEIGMVTHSYCMEYCDDFEIVRMTTNAFAGHVYNDAGFRHHEKRDYARSAELFALATFADPSSDLYAYNLSCAYARLGVGKAKPALALAIARGGDKIKTRAKADEDFGGVKSQAWFVDLTK